MTIDNSQSQEVDLDRTDRLPILGAVQSDEDVEDDAVPMDRAALFAPSKSNFPRTSSVDLPSLAESVRSVEERIARQSAEHAALTRSYDRARSAEAAAVSTAHGLADELTGMRTMLEIERARSNELDRSLALRDTSIAQLQRSLTEREAQLGALQREHAQVVPALEERSKSGSQLEAELRDARARGDSMAAQLKSAQDAVTRLAAQIDGSKTELGAARRELRLAKGQAGAYLERLRTREWRQGFELNVLRELDAQVGAAQQGRGSLQAQRDQLQLHSAAVEAQLVAREQFIADLTSQVTAAEARRSKLEHELQDRDGTRAALMSQIAALESDCERLTTDLAGKATVIDDVRAAAAADADRSRRAMATFDKARSDMALQVERLEREARTRDDEMSVLTAHLYEARRPIQSIEADVKQLTDQLAVQTAGIEALTEENRNLRLAGERTRGALEEREFLIRRLERSESNNANVLGRIQTSIERLGIQGAPALGAAAAPDCSGELIRVDGGQTRSHTLARRTRIGRAPGCELQIDSTSVSRHHALVVMGQHEVIIEDLNSTNGVLVNGRKVSRQVLNDGDLLTIGEAHFRCALSLAPRQADDSTTAAP